MRRNQSNVLISNNYEEALQRLNNILKYLKLRAWVKKHVYIFII